MRRIAIVFCGLSMMLSMTGLLNSAIGTEPEAGYYDAAGDFDARLARLESMLSPNGCTSQDFACVTCDSSPSVYAGFELIFMKPQMKESFEATLTNPALGTHTLVPLNFHFEVAPRAWIGFKADQSPGIRATYWGFDHNGGGQQFVSDGVNLPGATATTVIYPVAIIAPAPGDMLQTSSSLNVQTYDFEGTIDVKLQGMNMTMGGGLRYATSEQRMSALASRGGFPIGILNWNRSFEGFGPTLSGQGTRPLFGGLSAVANARASLLYGEKNLNRSVTGDITPPPVTGPPIVNLTGADEVVAAGEIGLGLRYSKLLANQSELFVQGTWQGQLWTEAGAPTLTFLGFEGIGVSAGVLY